ncbi:hypothetical protein M5689_013197 [Euphorbia peplus]|nr:hypothetical protein M5689_013197 [Euphorbia peplus]
MKFTEPNHEVHKCAMSTYR